MVQNLIVFDILYSMTEFDANIHPKDYLAKKAEGWTDVRIAASWQIDKRTIERWLTKELCHIRNMGVTFGEAWLDEKEYQQLINPNPNQSAQIYKEIRKRLIKHRKPGFSKDTLQQKMEKIDKLFEDGIYDVDQWSKARTTLNQSAIEALIEIRDLLKQDKK